MMFKYETQAGMEMDRESIILLYSLSAYKDKKR